MASKAYLVARVGLAKLWWWDPEHGESHSGISEYQDVLVTVYDRAPSAGEVQRAMDGIRHAVSEADGHAEVHSHALMDHGTWTRFGTPQRGTLEILHGTGLEAVIHFHPSLREALEIGIAAGAAFVEEGATAPNRDGTGPGDAE